MNHFIAYRRSTLSRYLLTPLFRGALAVALLAASAIAAETEPTGEPIKAQPLGAALTKLGLDTGLDIAAGSELIKGKTSSPVKSGVEPLTALGQILEGTGLTYRKIGEGKVAIRTPEPARASRQDSLVQLDSIMIRGELLDRDLQESFTSAVVLSGSEFSDRGERDIFDLIERTPGVSVLGDSGFIVRGISESGPGGAGSTGRLVTTNVDGATISNVDRESGLGPFSTWDLEQVEVLRGPQSTQAGRNALAGAIILRSNDPVYENEAKFRLQAASHNTLGGAFAVNAPLASDKVAIRIAGERIESDGTVKNTTLDVDSDERINNTLRFSLRWDLTDTLSTVLKHSISKVQTGESSIDPSLGIEERLSTADLLGGRENKTASTNFRLNADFSSSTWLEWESTFFESETFNQWDEDDGPTPDSFRLEEGEGDNHEHNLRLFIEEDRYKGVFGAYYTETEFVTAIDFVQPLADRGIPLPGNLSVLTNNTKEVQNYAIFVEAEYEITPQWDIILGARYDIEDNGTRNATLTASVDDPATQAILATQLGAFAESPPDHETSFKAFLPKIALGYNINDDLRLGLSSQKAYRAGGSQTRLSGDILPYDAEYAWNYELSLRSEWLDDRLLFNTNLFYMDWNDQQVVEIIDLEWLTVNAGKSRLYGGEFSFDFKQTEYLKWYASLAYVDTKFIEFESNGNDYSDNEFPNAPALTAALGLTRTFTNGWYISADVSATDDQYTFPDNTVELDARTLVNARVGYEAETWSINAYARNIFDEVYLIGVSTNTVTVGEPAVLGILAQYHF